jgi:hypothetical protein
MMASRRIAQVLKMAMVPMVAFGGFSIKKFFDSSAGAEAKKQWADVKAGIDAAFARIGGMIWQSKIFGRTITDWAKELNKFLNGLRSSDIQKFIKAFEKIAISFATFKGASLFGGLTASIEKLIYALATLFTLDKGKGAIKGISSAAGMAFSGLGGFNRFGIKPYKEDQAIKATMDAIFMQAMVTKDFSGISRRIGDMPGIKMQQFDQRSRFQKIKDWGLKERYMPAGLTKAASVIGKISGVALIIVNSLSLIAGAVNALAGTNFKSVGEMLKAMIPGIKIFCLTVANIFEVYTKSLFGLGEMAVKYTKIMLSAMNPQRILGTVIKGMEDMGNWSRLLFIDPKQVKAMADAAKSKGIKPIEMDLFKPLQEYADLMNGVKKIADEIPTTPAASKDLIKIMEANLDNLFKTSIDDLKSVQASREAEAKKLAELMAIPITTMDETQRKIHLESLMIMENTLAKLDSEQQRIISGFKGIYSEYVNDFETVAKNNPELAKTDKFKALKDIYQQLSDEFYKLGDQLKEQSENGLIKPMEEMQRRIEAVGKQRKGILDVFREMTQQAINIANERAKIIQEKNAPLGFSGQYMSGTEGVKFAQNVQRQSREKEAEINKQLAELKAKEIESQGENTAEMEKLNENFQKFLKAVLGKGLTTQQAEELSVPF